MKIDFCPFCGEKLPIPKQPSIEVGDYVIKTKYNEIRILPFTANGHDGIQYAEVTDTLIGQIAGPKIDYDNPLVDISSKLAWMPYNKMTIEMIKMLIKEDGSPNSQAAT